MEGEVGMGICHFSVLHALCPPHRLSALISSKGGEVGQNLNHQGLAVFSFLTSSFNHLSFWSPF